MIFSYTSNINTSGEYLKTLYKKRRGIETQYRVLGNFKLKHAHLVLD